MKNKFLACSIFVMVAAKAFAQNDIGPVTAQTQIGDYSSKASGVTEISQQSNLLKSSSKVMHENDGHKIIGSGIQDAQSNVPSVNSVKTKFQEFVAMSTGRNHEIFGAELFSVNRYGSSVNLPVSSDYPIGSGDEIDIRIWGNIDSAMRLTVDRDGQITIPKIGVVVLSGVSYGQLEEVIKRHVNNIYKGVEVSASLGKTKSLKIYVVGESKKPGSHVVPGYSTMIGAVFETGGPSALGTMRNINLIRNGKIVSTFDVYNFMKNGAASSGYFLKNEDVIQIPASGPRVAITGAFEKSAIYELKQEEESLSEVLSYGGGLSVLSTPYKLLLERVDPKDTTAARTINEINYTNSSSNVKLKNGDILTVLSIGNEFKNAVTLRGNVAAPLRYAFKSGMKISDLIPDPKALIAANYYASKNKLVQYESSSGVAQESVIAETKNMLDEINWDYAVVQRVDYSNVRTNLIKFNLKKAIVERDAANNIELKSGDVVTIFGVKDMPVPIAKVAHYVKISGEVNVPGLYQIDSGKSLQDLIEMAGGLTDSAFIYGSTFARESTRIQQQNNLNKAIRQMEGEITLQTNTLLQNATDTTSAGALQAQISGQRLFLQKLQSLSASGRVSLDLKPLDVKFPHLILENGDSINIPYKPSFVSAFGAVMAETSFLHKERMSVEDLIQKAGVTRSADVDSTFLIRADGSIEVNDASRSIWSMGGGFMNKKLNPGDTVFVPDLLDRRQAYSKFMQGAKDWTQIIYQFGLGVAAFKILRN